MHWAQPVPGFKTRNTSIMKPGQCDSGTPAWMILAQSQTRSIRLLGLSPGLKKVCASVVELEPLHQIHEDKLGVGGDFGGLNGRKVCADDARGRIIVRYFDNPSS